MLRPRFAKAVSISLYCPLAQRTAADLDDARRAERRHLVESRRAVDDQRVHRAELAQGTGDQRHPALVGDTHHLTARKGGIRERSDDVHYRRYRQLSPNGTHVPHSRMHQWREHEDDPRIVERSFHHWQRYLDRHAERLEDIRASTERR